MQNKAQHTARDGDAPQSSALAEDAVQQLLAGLEAAQHPAAASLREAWLLDSLLRHRLSSSLPRLRGSRAAAPEFSAVLPIFNEEENIPELYRRLTGVLETLGSYELIFVNDGSSDASERLIRGLREGDPRSSWCTCRAISGTRRRSRRAST